MDEDTQDQAKQRDIPGLIASLAVLGLIVYAAFQLGYSRGQANSQTITVRCNCQCSQQAK